MDEAVRTENRRSKNGDDGENAGKTPGRQGGHGGIYCGGGPVDVRRAS